VRKRSAAKWRDIFARLQRSRHRRRGRVYLLFRPACQAYSPLRVRVWPRRVLQSRPLCRIAQTRATLTASEICSPAIFEDCGLASCSGACGRASGLMRDPGQLTYFVLLEWAGDGLVTIRDFRFAATQSRALSCRSWVDWIGGQAPSSQSLARALAAAPDPLAVQRIEAGPYDDPGPRQGPSVRYVGPGILPRSRDKQSTRLPRTSARSR
jgi:hypothetical protein